MQIGSERYNLFTGCPHTKTVTFILRGGAEQFITETERSVAGGGAIEMELSEYLREYSRNVAGKKQLVIGAIVVKLNAITAATEACCLILSVDETIKAPKSQQEVPDAQRRIGMM